MSKEDLPELTKTLHESQDKWRNENWNQTIIKHRDEIEVLLKKINIFDIWANILQDDEVAKILIPEIFMDAYVSILFAGYGLYKNAHVCLRSELETALRLVFFSTHKVEFKWWSEGNEWYRENVSGDVWGPGLKYFQQLDTIKTFEKLCDDNRKIFSVKNAGIRGIHKLLSKFIHSGAGHFQTRPDRVSPKYEVEKFRKWFGTFKKVQEYIHITVALGFPEKFKKLSSPKKKTISEIGIESTEYREILKELLGA